ncbi:MAG: hypothetical protein Q8R15_04410, partial [Candidatus Micrarchaeota archaeon]|nr:hypothetical protein [Candidatus Micrarchaeota archaeon]
KATGKYTRREFLKGMGALLGTTVIGGSPIIAKTLLSRKGDASQRRIPMAVAKSSTRIDPLVYVRNAIMCHKIKALADKTGHTKIGLLVGAGHVDMVNLLEQGAALTAEQRTEIASRGPDALKMFRCIYNKQAGRWRVEEHSL